MNKLSIKTACEMAGISRPTIYKYINNGTLSAIKDGKNTFIDASELLRVFPNSQLNNKESAVNNLHSLTTGSQHKDEIIDMLKKQLEDKQKDNDFLKEQLTSTNYNFTQLNKLLENKQEQEKTTRKKFLGIF